MMSKLAGVSSDHLIWIDLIWIRLDDDGPVFAGERVHAPPALAEVGQQLGERATAVTSRAEVEVQVGEGLAHAHEHAAHHQHSGIGAV